MKILSTTRIREADAFTIEHEPVSSLALMERAGKECYQWIIWNTNTTKKYVVVCGTGNNGGDGLVIARLLSSAKATVEIIVLSIANQSEDFSKNLEALHALPVKIKFVKEGEEIVISRNVILIDAILGTGLTRPVDGWLSNCFDAINNSGNEIISIDLPSGVFADNHSTGNVIHANHTITFQCPKLAFFFPENEKYIGEFHVLDIGLDKSFIQEAETQKYFSENADVKKLLKLRAIFSHKGDFGKSLLISGSLGKIGAAVLAARACLRTGTGLLTVQVPRCGYEIMQSTVPEAMVQPDKNIDRISSLGSIDNFDAIGIGPGIGVSDETQKMFFDLLDRYNKPLVVDADALNILAEHPDRISKLPAGSVLTPHLREFERLAGKTADDFSRHELQLQFSKKHNVVVVLKGAYTCITTPDGRAYFNSTGNPGMAKGGSGDALTGMILALLAQQYIPEQAAVLAVYLHGAAGDIASGKKGVYSMISSDLIESIPKAFKKLMKFK